MSSCAQAGTGRAPSAASWKHVMLALLDSNPYLSDGSKQVQERRAMWQPQKRRDAHRKSHVYLGTHHM